MSLIWEQTLKNFLCKTRNSKLENKKILHWSRTLTSCCNHEHWSQTLRIGFVPGHWAANKANGKAANPPSARDMQRNTNRNITEKMHAVWFYAGVNGTEQVKTSMKASCLLFQTFLVSLHNPTCRLGWDPSQGINAQTLCCKDRAAHTPQLEPQSLFSFCSEPYPERTRKQHTTRTNTCTQHSINPLLHCQIYLKL